MEIQESTGGVSAPLSTNAPPAAPALPEFASVVPAEFKEKPYLKDVDSFEKLFKKLDGAQSLIGRRPAGIPQDTDPQDKWNEFFNLMGRPEQPDKYELGAPPEGYQRDEETLKALRSVFHQTGLNGKQASAIVSSYEKIILDRANKNQQAQEAEFDKISKETFGDRQDAVIAKSAQMLKDFAPAQFQPHIASLDNKTMIVLASVLDAVHNKYVPEDRGPTDRAPAAGRSAEEIRAEAQRLMNSDIYKNAFHPEHESTVRRVREMYKSLP